MLAAQLLALVAVTVPGPVVQQPQVATAQMLVAIRSHSAPTGCPNPSGMATRVSSSRTSTIS
jgi:hypothetical protein